MRYVLALAPFGLTAVAPITAVPAAAQSVAAEQTVTFAVDNMTRALCPITVQRAMEGVEGVTAVEIDFEAGRVVFDTDATTADVIAEASANAGNPAVTGR